MENEYKRLIRAENDKISGNILLLTSHFLILFVFVCDFVQVLNFFELEI